MMDDVDLTFKKDALAKTLSGGQKRRLSVAMVNSIFSVIIFDYFVMF